MDRDTFSREVWDMRESMLRFALSRLHRRQDAEDAVQEAVLAAWERLHTLRDETRFRTWMMSIVANKCKMTLRRNRRVVLPGELPEREHRGEEAQEHRGERPEHPGAAAAEQHDDGGGADPHGERRGGAAERAAHPAHR